MLSPNQEIEESFPSGPMNASEDVPSGSDSSPASPLNASEDVPSGSDSSPASPSSDNSSDNSSNSSDSSDSSDSSGSSDNSSDSSDDSEDEKCLPKSSKQVFFDKEFCRWTIIEHPMSVHQVRNFVQTANDAYVLVDFMEEFTTVDITLGDPEEKLYIGMKASNERNSVTVAEEYQPPMGCATYSDLEKIGSYNYWNGENLPPNARFGTTDRKITLQRTRGGNEFVTDRGSRLRFLFGKNKDGKDMVKVCFRYGEDESDELGFDFDVNGKDMNLNFTSALTPLFTIKLVHDWTVKAPAIEEKNGTKESTTTTTTMYKASPRHNSLTTCTSTTSTSTTTTTSTTIMHSTTGGTVKAKEKKT